MQAGVYMAVEHHAGIRLRYGFPRRAWEPEQYFCGFAVYRSDGGIL